jgi:PRTRC genetic system ThiF family protein
MHRIDPELLEDDVTVHVIGCGGTGSAIAAGLVYLHQAMLAFGHPEGLHVTIFDPDTVSPANCVRQAFSVSEIGLHKASVIATRINSFWGYAWDAQPIRYTAEAAQHYGRPDIIIGCVDTRAARREIARACRRVRPSYWLDLGNDAETGQFVLGEPLHPLRSDRPSRLRTVAEKFPELVDEALDDDNLPSCSAEEALTRQAPFVNQVLANHALSLLARLFRYGRIDKHGGLVNLQTGFAVGIPVPARAPYTMEEAEEIGQLLLHSDWDPADVADAFDLDDLEINRIHESLAEIDA